MLLKQFESYGELNLPIWHIQMILYLLISNMGIALFLVKWKVPI